MNLFVYGTLQEKSTLEELIVREIFGRPQAAQINNYEKINTPFGYPIILPKEGSRVSGLLWTDLCAEDLEKLDLYEDCDEDPPLYYRVEEDVEVNRSPVKAYFYVGNHTYWKEHL